MANLEVLALDTATPQIRAPAAGDGYAVPRSMFMSDTSGYYGPTGAYGLNFNLGGGYCEMFANGRSVLRLMGTAPFGVNVDFRIGFGNQANSAADCGIERIAAKILKITDGGTVGASGNGAIALPFFTVGTLPAAAANTQGARSTVSDSSVVAAGNFGAVVAGAGANVAPVYCDGAAWRIG